MGNLDFSIDLTHPPHVRLRYTVRETGKGFDYRVALAATNPNYGGQRWWLICPMAWRERLCRRRVRKLYLPPMGTYFGCRHCWQLSYASQRQDEMHRALSKAQAIRESLEGSGSMTKAFPSKPKGMRWRTYYRLWAKSEERWMACLRRGLGLPPD